MQDFNEDDFLVKMDFQQEDSDTLVQDDPVTINSSLIQLHFYLARNDQENPPLLEQFSALKGKSFRQMLYSCSDDKTDRLLISRLQRDEGLSLLQA